MTPPENQNAERSEDEIYADAFADQLLMPEPHVERFRAEGLSVEEMAERFDVPLEAVERRLGIRSDG